MMSGEILHQNMVAPATHRVLEAPENELIDRK
jgi:hypothetical protein